MVQPFLTSTKMYFIQAFFSTSLKTTFKMNTCSYYPHLLSYISAFSTTLHLFHIPSCTPFQHLSCAVFLWSFVCKDEWKERCVTGLCARACFAQLVFVPPGSATNRLRFLPVAGLLSDSPCWTEGPVSVRLRTRAAETPLQPELNLSRGTSSKLYLKFN